jgi:hypothetical protein
MSKLSPDPADRPWPEDPPIDALSMVEVAEDAFQKLNVKRENALDVQRRYAVLAILEGVPPEEVAHACGFTEAPVELPDPIRRMIGPPNPTEMQRFAGWLATWLAQQILGSQRTSVQMGGNVYTDLEDDDD